MLEEGVSPTPSMEERRRALLAIILVGAAPSLSTLASFTIDNGTASQVIFVITKLWLLCFPLYWLLKGDRGSSSWSKPQQGGYLMSIGLGVGMSVGMVGTWLLLGDAIDANLLSDALEPVGLMDPNCLLYTSDAADE